MGSDNIYRNKNCEGVLRDILITFVSDKNKLFHAISVLLLANWIISFFLNFKYSWAFFIFGPFISIGFILSNIFGIKHRVSALVYISLINSIIFITGVGFIGTLIKEGDYSQQAIIFSFSVFYLIASIASFRKNTNINGIEFNSIRADQTKYILLSISTLIMCYISTQTVSNGGTVYLNYISYFLLSLIIIYCILYEVSENNAIIIVLLVGIGMIWLRAFSTQDLFAGDGRHSARLAQMMIETGVSMGADGSRTSTMLSVRYLLPSLSLLSDKNVEFVSQYILPTLAGVSLIGVFSLNCNWLTSRDSLIATFVLATKTMFFTAMIINFRTMFAFLVLVAFYITLENSGKNQYILSVVFLIGVIGFHDTVGLFTISLLVIYTLVSYSSKYLIKNTLSKPKGVFLFAISGSIYYALFLETRSFESIVILVSYTLYTYLGGDNLEVRQDAASHADNISGSIAGTLFISSISIEMLLAALATTLIICCWLFRDTAASRLKEFSPTQSMENLIVANSILFGTLILVPRLGVHRVFLYSSPLLVGLIPLSIRQLEYIDLGNYVGRLYNWDVLIKILLTMLIIFGFINNVGFLFLMVEDGGTEGAHIGAKDSDNYYFENTDVEAKQWVAKHLNQNIRIYADYYGRNFFHSDPRIRSHEALPPGEEPQKLDGCIFSRSSNEKNEEFYINDPGNMSLEYRDTFIHKMNVVYSSRNTKIRCVS